MRQQGTGKDKYEAMVRMVDGAMESDLDIKKYSAPPDDFRKLRNRIKKKRREREPCSLKAWLLIALAVPSNLCDFNPLEITTPCKFQQQGIYFPSLNPLYTIYYLLFTIGNLGWVRR